MWFRRSTVLTLATVATTLGAAGPVLAMPAHDDQGAGDAGDVPAVVLPAAPSPDDGGGLGTLAVVLLSSGALVAGAAAGFGGARASAGRAPLH